jgi:hypothetical protein
VLAVALVLQIPYRLWALRHACGLPLGESVPWAFGWTLVALLISHWLLERVRDYGL